MPGEAIAPPHRMTSRVALIAFDWPPWTAWTPTARLLSNITLSTVVSVRMVRFARLRTGSMNAVDALTLRPLYTVRGA